MLALVHQRTIQYWILLVTLIEALLVHSSHSDQIKDNPGDRPQLKVKLHHDPSMISYLSSMRARNTSWTQFVTTLFTFSVYLCVKCNDEWCLLRYNVPKCVLKVVQCCWRSYRQRDRGSDVRSWRRSRSRSSNGRSTRTSRRSRSRDRRSRSQDRGSRSRGYRSRSRDRGRPGNNRRSRESATRYRSGRDRPPRTTRSRTRSRSESKPRTRTSRWVFFAKSFNCASS